MGDVLQFDEMSRAPRRMAWICPLCGRMSLLRYPWAKGVELTGIAHGWDSRCADVAILVEVEKIIFNHNSNRCISLHGQDGPKYARIQELTRQIAIRDGKSLYHL